MQPYRYGDRGEVGTCGVPHVVDIATALNFTHIHRFEGLGAHEQEYPQEYLRSFVPGLLSKGHNRAVNMNSTPKETTTGSEEAQVLEILSEVGPLYEKYLEITNVNRALVGLDERIRASSFIPYELV